MIVQTVQEPGKPAQSLEERADSIVFIKEGFTRWGFLFGPLWLLYNRLWLEFIAALLIGGGLAGMLSQAGLRDQAVGIANFALMLIVGFEGNDLKRWRLYRKGYSLLAPVAGRDYEDCERRFFDAWLPQTSGGGAMSNASPAMELKAPPQPGGDWRGPNAIGTLPGAMA